MNYFKRAFLSVWKRKGKNLLFIVAFCVITTLMLACISIRTAAVKAEADAKTKTGSSVTVKPDSSKAPTRSGKAGYNSFTEEMDPALTNNMLDRLGEIRHVTSYNYAVNMPTSGLAHGFEPFFNQDNQDEITRDMQADMPTAVAGNLNLYGAMNSAQLDYFTSGDYKLLEGRQLKNNDTGKAVVMIEKSLADKNGLKLGDTIKVSGTDKADVPTSLMIIGIFQAPPVTGIEAGFVMNNPSDTVFVPYDFAQKTVQDDYNKWPQYKDQKIGIEPTYYLDSPASIDQFKSEASKISGMDKFTFDAHDETYQRMIGPLQNVAGFTNGMVIFIMLASCLILCLIAVLSVKNRQQEFGILLAVGEKKRKIIGQIALEALLPMLAAVCLSIPFGNAIAQGMGSSLLNGQVQSAQQQDQNNGNGITQNANGQYVFSGNTNNESTKNVKSIDKINVAAAPADYEKLALLCLLIVVFSASVPTVSIYRLNPRAILIKNE